MKFPVVIQYHTFSFYNLKIPLFARSLFSNVCLLCISQVSPEKTETIGHVYIYT